MSTKLSIFCTKIIEGGWLAALISVPLFFNIHTARTFEPDKLTLMRSLALLMIAAWLVKVLEEGQIFSTEIPLKVRFRAWLKQPLVLPTVTLVGSYLISTILALTPLVAVWGSYQRLQGTFTMFSYIVIFALMAATMRERGQVDRLINTIIITSVPVSLYGIIQRNGLDPLPWAGDVTQRVASNMGNAIFVASYLIMIVPVTLNRLIRSMTAIVTEEDASWGHTILSAIYIFVLAVQILTILYSQSRGPQIGLLGAFALMGLLYLLILRQKGADRSAITLQDVGFGIGLVIGLGLGTAVGGGVGYLGGLGVDALLNLFRLQAEGIPLLGAALGGLIGFGGVYTYLAATNRGWRRLWLSWPILAIGAMIFVLLLNIPDGPLQSLRTVPYLSRLGQVTNTERGTGRVRVLIWEGAINLISPHRPLGVDGEYADSLNPVRPFVGYGPESMFNAFAYAYPTELAYVESRGSSADRSHNETMDSLVITGLFGFAVFYFLMGSVFFYLVKWLGWVPTKNARNLLIALLGVCGLIGMVAPYFVVGNFNLSAVFLPFGLFAALLIYLTIRGLLPQPNPAHITLPERPLLLIGILGALVGHFLEVHFVFSIAATYTYFWGYLGLMTALHFMQGQTEPLPTVDEAVAEAGPTTQQTRKERRRRRRTARSTRKASTGSTAGRGGWESWLGSHGLIMAIILIILVFDFVPVQFDPTTGRYSLMWMTSITLLVGLAIAMGDTAINLNRWRKPVNYLWGLLIFLVTSLGYGLFYFLLHGQQRQSILRLASATSQQIQAGSQIADPIARQQGLLDVIPGALASANGVFGLLVGFYAGLLILLIILAFMLSQGATKRLPTWQSANWWLYPPLILAIFLVIWFKNINVVKADTFLKEAQKYRDARLWDVAIAIHEESVRADSDEDFYYLMLALGYQLKAQDHNLPPETRQIAWQQGEKIALQARDINKFNPDNTGNMGRYYFTIAQVFEAAYFEKALEFFQKATELAPQNVDYYNLVGQAYYATAQYDEALAWYTKSATIDERYYPTWLYKGDTHVAQQQTDEALEAHTKAIAINAPGFIDDNFDTRLNFHLSTDNANRLIEAMETYLAESPAANRGNNTGKTLWGIGHIYSRVNETDKAADYYQQAINAGYDEANVLIELGNVYLNRGEFDRAETTYQLALSKNPNLTQVHSGLGYIFAQTGRLEEAIAANRRVLEAIPNDYDSNKNLALLYQQLGQLNEALTHAQVALGVADEASKAELSQFIAQVEGQIQQTQSSD